MLNRRIALLTALSGLLLLSAETYADRSDCERHAAGEPKQVLRDPPETQWNFILQIRTSTNPRVQNQAFEDLYANYKDAIETSSGYFARKVAGFVPGNWYARRDYLIEVSKAALKEAILHYDLKYPKPGSYLMLYVRFFLIDVVVTQDGRLKRNKTIHREMNQHQRQMLFTGQLDRLFLSLEKKIPLEKLRKLYQMYSNPEFSLNALISDGESNTEFGELVTSSSNQGEFGLDRTLTIRKLVREAVTRLVDRLDERDRTILRMAVLCEDPRDHTLQEIGDLVGLSYEGVRLRRDEIKKQLRYEIGDTLVDRGEFIDSLSDKEAAIAVTRIWPAKILEPPSTLAKALQIPRAEVGQLEAEVKRKYERHVRENLAEILNSSDGNSIASSLLEMRGCAL
jgi:DNA-directed RNA polymerase specialized sigma subunit